jgi:hypothetical protein
MGLHHCTSLGFEIVARFGGRRGPNSIMRWDLGGRSRGQYDLGRNCTLSEVRIVLAVRVPKSLVEVVKTPG